jgi:hypothetical protein
MIVYTFTGTRQGMTPRQHQTGFRLLDVLKPDLMNNGCCVGSDRDWHSMCRDTATIQTEYHPCNHLQMEWAKVVRQSNEFIHPVLGPIKRNHKMADSARGLIAMVSSYAQIRRSGTWATVRYALNKNMPVWIVYPDGTMRVE